jgi:predicted transcriptional regulator
VDQRADRSVVLMSIHPHWASAIMEGRKRVEFRRSRFGRPVSHVVVYATSPVRRVVGYFEVSDLVDAAPAELWEMFADVGEIGADAFDGYFDGAESGVAIRVGRVSGLSTPIELEELIPSAVPPQSYRYADRGVIVELDRLA